LDEEFNRTIHSYSYLQSVWVSQGKKQSDRPWEAPEDWCLEIWVFEARKSSNLCPEIWVFEDTFGVSLSENLGI